MVKNIAEDDIAEDDYAHSIGDLIFAGEATHLGGTSAIALTEERQEALTQAAEAVAESEFDDSADQLTELAGHTPGSEITVGTEYLDALRQARAILLRQSLTKRKLLPADTVVEHLKVVLGRASVGGTFTLTEEHKTALIQGAHFIEQMGGHFLFAAVLYELANHPRGSTVTAPSGSFEALNWSSREIRARGLLEVTEVTAEQIEGRGRGDVKETYVHRDNWL